MTSNSPLIALYPGSFDPITLGHEDLVRRALRFSHRVILAVAHQPSQEKRGLFTVAERLELIREVFRDESRVEVAEFAGLLVEFARARGATLIIRGLRSVTDFEYEFQMALTNRELAPELETIFLAPVAGRSYISSSLVREVSALGGDPAAFVPPAVLQHLRKRFPRAGG